MKRLLLSFTFVMVIASAGILFFQWNGFLSGSAEESDISEVNQSFAIEHIGNEFFITQEVDFISGSSKELMIEWPEHAKNFSCMDDSGDDCLSKENGEFFINVEKEEKQKLTLTYTLERQTSDGSLLLSGWYPALSSAIPLETTINIIEKTSRDADWISGYKNTKHEEMDFIDYYSFKGLGPPSDLLLYSGEMNLHEFEKANIYSREKIKFNFGENVFNENGFVTVVIDDHLPSHETENFLIIGKVPAQSTLLQKIKWGLEQQKYSASYQERWLKELKASMVLQTVLGSPKTLKVYHELESGLTRDQFAAFRRLLMNDSSHLLKAGQIDSLLKHATNFTSSYFNDVSKNPEKEMPLILMESRTVVLNERPLKGAVYIQYHQEELISLTELLQAAGIEYKYLQEDVIYATERGNSYRFYIDKDYFILNEENYGLLTKPVQKVGSKVFMDVEWLEKLFEMEVDRTSTTIEIQTKET
jgi:hypothetical protein